MKFKSHIPKLKLPLRSLLLLAITWLTAIPILLAKDIWKEEAAKSFMADEYILVIETIINFQYSIDNLQKAS